MLRCLLAVIQVIIMGTDSLDCDGKISDKDNGKSPGVMSKNLSIDKMRNGKKGRFSVL